MREVPISRGMVALVDDVDYERVSILSWNAMKPARSHTWYASSTHRGRTVYMHRLIMGLEHGDRRVVDHRNHEGLDNQRGNLRVVSQTVNMLNRRGPTRHNRSTGVLNIEKPPGRGYVVLVTVAGKRHQRCGIATLDEAIEIRDALRRDLGVSL